MKAPQGLTNDRFNALLSLSQNLAPIQRFVSLVIDEAPLVARLSFDSNGMVIGHAVNDLSPEDSANDNNSANMSGKNEPLANRMISYVVQGLALDLEHVSIS